MKTFSLRMIRKLLRTPFEKIQWKRYIPKDMRTGRYTLRQWWEIILPVGVEYALKHHQYYLRRWKLSSDGSRLLWSSGKEMDLIENEFSWVFSDIVFDFVTMTAYVNKEKAADCMAYLIYLTLKPSDVKILEPIYNQIMKIDGYDYWQLPLESHERDRTAVHPSYKLATEEWDAIEIPKIPERKFGHFDRYFFYLNFKHFIHDVLAIYSMTTLQQKKVFLNTPGRNWLKAFRLNRMNIETHQDSIEALIGVLRGLNNIVFNDLRPNDPGLFNWLNTPFPHREGKVIEPMTKEAYQDMKKNE